MKNLDKDFRNKAYVVIVSTIVILISIFGYTFSYFSAIITENNKTETILNSNVLGLTFTGVKEISIMDIIPGDIVEKTFAIENTSNRAVTYNIYMDAVVNQFNEDLVYTLIDDSGTIISREALPETNPNRTYLLTNVSIGTGETKHYTLKIEFLYSENNSQNLLQGKIFNGTLGIDSTPNAVAVSARDISYTSEFTECSDVECSVNELYEILNN